MVDSTVVGGGRGRPRGAGRRGLLAAVAALALVLVAVGLAPNPSSRAATGTAVEPSPVWAGWLAVGGGECTATLVRPWMAITARHCGTENPVLKLGVTSTADSNPAKVYTVTKIVKHDDLDVEALYLDGSAPWSNSVTWGDGYGYDPASKEPLRLWGFGLNSSDTDTGRLTVATFPRTDPCASGLGADQGDFCFNVTDPSSNGLCAGDSGAPITQGNKIVAMATAVLQADPTQRFSCSKVAFGQAIPITKIAGWLHDRSCEA
ncbi:MAG TPA: trypsin-like serine protease, partial [Kineosporiaceae bacterium]